MSTNVAALATLAAAGTAFAQSTATISGSINVGVMDTGAAGAKAGVASLGGGANAIDINTVEDLGGGLRGGFSSQIRYNAATGDRGSSGTGSALFHSANAYLSGGFGTARVGKIAEASNCGFDAWGCTGGAGFGAGVGTSTLAGALAVANAVSYTTPNISGFSASAMSSVSARNEERTSFTLSYAKGPIAAQYLQTNGTGNTAGDINLLTLVTALGGADGTATDAQMAAAERSVIASVPTDRKAKQSSIAASYNFGVARLNVLNVKEEGATGTTTKDVTAINGSMPMGAVTLLAGYAKDKKAAANADTKVSLGVNYALSKRSTLGADLFKADQGANSGTGLVVRMRHTF